MVHFPKEIFTKVLQYCGTTDKDKHRQVWQYIRVIRMPPEEWERDLPYEAECGYAVHYPSLDEKGYEIVRNYLLEIDDGIGIDLEHMGYGVSMPKHPHLLERHEGSWVYRVPRQTSD